MNLPLTNKLNEENIFSQLNLPLSSNWQDIKKVYENRTKDLSSEIKSATDKTYRSQLEQKLKHLETAYQGFSQRVSKENARAHQTKDALKSVGLSETADWDKVSKRFEDIRQSQPEQAQSFQPHFGVLDKNKDLLTTQAKLGKRTLLTTALVLGTAGVSLAAFYHLSQEEKEQIMEVVEQNPSGLEGVVGETAIAPILDQEALEKYITDNTQFEDEMLALLGLAPSPELSLSLQYKMQVFSALVNSI